jgi:hypothetical protein
MNLLSVKPPTIPIPFHKYLKVVAIVNATDPQTKRLLDHIAAENFEIEISDRFDRDVSEDATRSKFCWVQGSAAGSSRISRRQEGHFGPSWWSSTLATGLMDDSYHFKSMATMAT